MGDFDFSLGFSSSTDGYSVIPLFAIDFNFVEDQKLTQNSQVEAVMCFASQSQSKPYNCISHRLKNRSDTYWVESWFH